MFSNSIASVAVGDSLEALEFNIRVSLRWFKGSRTVKILTSKRLSEKFNKHGLSRYIPAEIRREIRQRCGFGCVICGAGIVQYEHVNLEFKDATEHAVKAMTLLCPSCHFKVTTGMGSKKSVELAMLEPCALKKGFSNDFFDFGNNLPEIVLGGATFIGGNIPIQIHGFPLMRIDPPETAGGPFLLSANFFDSRGKNSLNIIKNEWRAKSDNWDVEIVGNELTIREKIRRVHLKFRVNPPKKIIISYLYTNLGPFWVYADESKDTCSIMNPLNGRGMTFENLTFEGGRIAYTHFDPDTNIHLGKYLGSRINQEDFVEGIEVFHSLG